MSKPEASLCCQEWVQDNAPKSGERYRHYKGGDYEVVCSSVDEATLFALVTYRSLARGYVWTRTFADWSAQVDLPDGRTVPRFSRIGRTEESSMYVTVTQGSGDDRLDAILLAIDVAKKISRDVVFKTQTALDLIVSADDTAEKVAARMAQHPKEPVECRTKVAGQEVDIPLPPRPPDDDFNVFIGNG